MGWEGGVEVSGGDVMVGVETLCDVVGKLGYLVQDIGSSCKGKALL